MSYATGRISGKGGANYECPVCGFVWKNYDTLLRWDRKLVCPKCWEPRHILDFYRTRNDFTPLPFIFPLGKELTYTPVFTNLTQTPGNGSITIKGVYYKDSIPTTPIVNATVTINSQYPATTSNSGGTMTLPVTALAAGTWRAMDGLGTILGTGTVSLAATTINLPSWNTTKEMIVITAQFAG